MEEYECFMDQNFIKSPVFSEIEYLWNYLYFWQVLRYFFYFQEANFLGSSGELGAPAPQRKKNKNFFFSRKLEPKYFACPLKSPDISSFVLVCPEQSPRPFLVRDELAYLRFPEKSLDFTTR